MIDQPFNRDKLNRLRAWMREARHVLVAYSGGVDSSLLLRIATEELDQDALGMMAVSPSLPEGERQQAVELAQVMGARLKLVPTQETDDVLVGVQGVDDFFFLQRGQPRKDAGRFDRLLDFGVCHFFHLFSGQDDAHA